jgi:hypothetical protein
MSVIHIHRRIDSETLHLPELRPLIGKTVQIVVTEQPAPPSVTEKDWEAFFAEAGTDLVDPDVYKRYREFDSSGSRRDAIRPRPDSPRHL